MKCVLLTYVLFLRKVVGIALSCMRTIDVECLPFLVRFVLLSANAGNARRIVYQIRENLTFIFSQSDSATVQRKLKGKFVSGANEVSILEALSSIVLFKSVRASHVVVSHCNFLNEWQHIVKFVKFYSRCSVTLLSKR